MSKSNLLLELYNRCLRHNEEKIILCEYDLKLSFRDFDQVTNSLAAKLVHSEEEFVFVICPRSKWLPIFFWACVKAGKVYAPIEFDIPDERINNMISSAGDAQIFTAEERKIDPRFGQHLLSDDYFNELRLEKAVSNEAHNSICCLLHTSGSTGTPKGIKLTHAGIVNRMEWMIRHYNINQDDIILFKTPHSFDVHLWEIIVPFLSGARLEILGANVHKNIPKMIKFIAAKKISRIHFVPSVLRLFLKFFKSDQCQSLKNVFCSGEELLPIDALEFYKKIPRCRLHNLYGPAEASVDVTYFDIKNESLENLKKIPIGRPIDNTVILILDENMNKVPHGETGEIYIAGVALSQGYTDNALTEKSFLNNPFSLNDRDSIMYKTGDLACINSEGEIIYLGRQDNQVKLNGVRIEIGEIEHELSSIEGIESCHVLYDIQRKQIFGFVVSMLEPQEIMAKLAKTLPKSYLPSKIFTVKNIPLTMNGKVDKELLLSCIKF